MINEVSEVPHPHRDLKIRPAIMETRRERLLPPLGKLHRGGRTEAVAKEGALDQNVRTSGSFRRALCSSQQGAVAKGPSVGWGGQLCVSPAHREP